MNRKIRRGLWFFVMVPVAFFGYFLFIEPTLTIDTNLRRRTKLTAEQLDQALATFAPPLEGLGEYVKRSEENYGVNALFMTALAIHESTRGTSEIFIKKNNPYGWNALDGSAYEDAYTFGDLEGATDWVGRRMRAHFFDRWDMTTLRKLNEGTEKSSYQKYSTDPLWRYKMLGWMGQVRDVALKH